VIGVKGVVVDEDVGATVPEATVVDTTVVAVAIVVVAGVADISESDASAAAFNESGNAT
jgi:hypothetical protein